MPSAISESFSLYLPSFRCFQNPTCDVSSLLKVLLILIQFFLFFPLPSALNIHKVPLTGPLSVIASLIISLLPLLVISLVQPTVKPLRPKDLRFFFFERFKVDPFFLCTMSLIQPCLVCINYGSFWICLSGSAFLILRTRLRYLSLHAIICGLSEIILCLPRFFYFL